MKRKRPTKWIAILVVLLNINMLTDALLFKCTVNWTLSALEETTNKQTNKQTKAKCSTPEGDLTFILDTKTERKLT